ncbi:MAG: GntR family transcriptional regulator [Ornithinimicrobium sp.]
MRIDPGSSAPVFQQICDSIVSDIRAGQIVPGTHLPPVRHLAADLEVAANTVAKAYKQLGEEGHVRTQGRNGTVVLPPPRPGPADQSSAAVAVFVQAAQAHGLTLNEAIGLVRQTW